MGFQVPLWAASSGMHQPQGSQKAGLVPNHWDVTNISVKQHFGIWEAMGFYWIHETCAFIMQVYCVFVEIKEVLGDAEVNRCYLIALTVLGIVSAGFFPPLGFILHESNLNLIARLHWTPAEALCSLIFTLG